MTPWEPSIRSLEQRVDAVIAYQRARRILDAFERAIMEATSQDEIQELQAICGRRLGEIFEASP